MSIMLDDILHVGPTLAAAVDRDDQYVVTSGDVPYKTGLRLKSEACLAENMPLPIQEQGLVMRFKETTAAVLGTDD